MSDMKIQRLGECMYWSSELDQDAKFVITNFDLCLSQLKNDLKSMEQSPYVQAIINHYLYSNKNSNYSPFELFSKGADETMTFTPVSSFNLNWNNWSFRRVESDIKANVPEKYNQNEVVRLEIRLELLACADKQILLNKKLAEWQRQLKSQGQKWVHFSDRIEMFWKYASEVTLKKSVHFEPYSEEEKKMLDCLFFANTTYRSSYLSYIHTIYDKEKKLVSRLTELEKILSDLATVFTTPKEPWDDRLWTYLTVLQDEIGSQWSMIWSSENSNRYDLECYLTDGFVQEMKKLDRCIVGIKDIRKQNDTILIDYKPKVEDALKRAKTAKVKWNKIMSELPLKNASSKRKKTKT